MKHKVRLGFLGCATAVFCTVAPSVLGQEQDSVESKASTSAASTPNTSAARTTSNEGTAPATRMHPLFVDILASRGLKPRSTTPPAEAAKKLMSTGTSTNKASSSVETEEPRAGTSSSTGPGQTLPLFTFRVTSSRDGDKYSGAMVGDSPFKNPGTTKVPTKIVPVILKLHTIGTSFDPNTGLIATEAGDTTFDPTRPDNVCLSAPNNVPTTLVRQSPIFSPAHFVFGGTDVGTTEYSDAFQRANFWNVLGKGRDKFHVLLEPEVLDPIVLDVPAVYGVALTNPDFFGPPPFCAPLGIVDINWFDTHLAGTVIPSLDEVDPTNFPVFLVYNAVWAAPANNIFTCCILGYHGTTGFPIPTQTYSPAGFDTTQAFFTASGDTSGFSDTAILSHEVDEWMDDPMLSNPTPPWGHTGQVGGCQANLEVGDPLTGNTVPAVTMPNGFTYHLQELAFFSWFFGAPSTGVNGWFSNNGTFLTDAGAPCH
jgi:hypothetical protein